MINFFNIKVLTIRENSLRSINEAIKDGAEIVEIDVMLTADGVPVLMHDTTVDRTTNGTGRVSDFILAEIKKLRLKEGLGGKTAKLTDYTVPTLEEAMLAAKDRVIVNLDKGWKIREEMYDVLVKTDTVDHGLFEGSPNVEEAAEFMAKDLEILYMHIINDNTADTVDTFPGRVSASVAPAGIIRLEWDGDFSEEIEVENTTNTL
ncbi:hypothetical protein COE51_21435 [Bacillus pseudomycoides]|nr:hypothetical protein COE51_21435 [Bacillus pseudomycoides]